MILRTPKFHLYLTLVIIVSFCVSLRSLTQVYFQFKKETIEQSVFPILYAAKLQSNLGEILYEEIRTKVESIQDINETEHILSIPQWDGPQEYGEEWKQLWKTHLAPILYATSEFQVDPSERAPQIADQIQNVSGVMEVVWDQDRFNRYAANMDQWKKEQQYFSILFFLFMAAIIVALILGYPVRFKREFVVRTGFAGAGSQINPEYVWLQLSIVHIAVSVICYSMLFTLGYLLFPFPSPGSEGPGFFAYLAEGACITGALAAAICLVGWWFKTDEVDVVTSIQPPSRGWNQD